ncbi:hypothetical protein [Nocardia sp. NBC_01327]|uniref:hypothetical protein n=1 Tax=Nocardia sp. NBC_01327 TaxID=2903593 RepID=UPI002E10F95A|nr:hypothetical protein OG326_24030 [Nocardia sp. NBC_01327]
MSRARTLTDAQALTVVAECRRGISQVRMAHVFGVSRQLVGSIMSGRRYSDVTGISPCCTNRGCEQCRPGRRGTTRDRNIAVVRASMAYIGCVACGNALSRPIGAVLATRGLHRCIRCVPSDTPGSGHGQCSPDAPCTKCRAEDAREENVRLVRAVDVDVECVVCDSTITRPAGPVLDRKGAAHCHKHLRSGW